MSSAVDSPRIGLVQISYPMSSKKEPRVPLLRTRDPASADLGSDVSSYPHSLTPIALAFGGGCS